MYDRVRYWLSNYGTNGMSDQRAIQTYMDVENDELIRSLQNELIGISSGSSPEEALAKVLGKNRSVIHGSHMEWARLMLRWMAEYRK